LIPTKKYLGRGVVQCEVDKVIAVGSFKVLGGCWNHGADSKDVISRPKPKARLVCFGMKKVLFKETN
jgi:hypothetical protein